MHVVDINRVLLYRVDSNSNGPVTKAAKWKKRRSAISEKGTACPNKNNIHGSILLLTCRKDHSSKRGCCIPQLPVHRKKSSPCCFLWIGCHRLFSLDRSWYRKVETQHEVSMFTYIILLLLVLRSDSNSARSQKMTPGLIDPKRGTQSTEKSKGGTSASFDQHLSCKVVRSLSEWQ